MIRVDELFMMNPMTSPMMDSSPHDSPKSHLQDIDNKILAWKLHRNTLVPIARLPPEILSIIFSLLSASGPSLDHFKRPSRFFIPITPSSLSHVCHRWREISLNLPCFWSHINLTELTPACAAEMLARAKMAPLHLAAAVTIAHDIENIMGPIEAHIRHTRLLSISANIHDLQRMFGRLISSAPSLEQLYINSWFNEALVPDNLFDGIAPKLSDLHLKKCGISWVSPIFKGLRCLELSSFPRSERTTLNVWLDALNQMPQLERLSLYDGIPIHSVTALPLPVEPGPTVVLSSLRELDIHADTQDCFAVLAHVILPALTRLCVIVETTYHDTPTPQLISWVVRNAYGPQDTEALQSLFIENTGDTATTVAWALPRQDDTYSGSRFSVEVPDGLRLARVAYGTTNIGPAPRIAWAHHLLLAALPLNHIVSITVNGHAPHCRWIWSRHAPRWNKLQRVRLSSSAVPSFREMLEAAPRGDPLLPSLQELVLIDVFLIKQKVYYLYKMLVELKNPLTTLDLRTCIVSDWAVQLLSGITVDVLGPIKRRSGFLYEGRWGNNGVLEEERKGDHGFDKMPLPLGSWDKEEFYNHYDDSY